MRVLLTGASGYLGVRVGKRLGVTGVDFVAADRHAAPGIVATDLTDVAAVTALIRDAKPDTIIHCAAAVPKTSADYGDDSAATVSLRMVHNLCTALPGGRIVFISSMTVYPDDTELAREDDPISGRDAYSRGKRDAEAYLLGSGSSGAILRLPGLFGAPRRGGVLFNAALAFARGQTFQVDDPPVMWAAIHVDDAADAIVRALALPRGSHVMNVGYDERMSIEDAVARIAALFGRTGRQRTSQRWFQLDVTRMQGAIGPLDHTFDDRLRELADWARSIAQDS